MTKMKNIIVLIAAVTIVAVFASCSNPVSPLNSAEALMSEEAVDDDFTAAESTESVMTTQSADNGDNESAESDEDENDDQNGDSDSNPVDEPIQKTDPAESKNTDDIVADDTDDDNSGNSNKGPGNNNGQGKDQGNHYGWYK
jgi:hypothetical protein